MDKYMYFISLSGEGDESGYVELTTEEAAIVHKALDSNNWENVISEAWAPTAFIDIEHPLTREEMLTQKRE